MALTYSWRQFVQRIWRHLNNDFPGADYTVSEREILLYINEAMSFGLIGQVYSGAKIIGSMEVPEAYLVTFKLAALAQDAVTNYWYSAMPQPPLSLPLGYSVVRGYFADATNGEGEDWFLIKAKRVGRRKNMPMQFGVRAWFENGKVCLAASNNTSLYGKTGYIQMPSTRVINVTDPVNIPDDAIEMIFTKVVARLKERLALPQDVIQDDLPTGNKVS